MGNQLPRGQLQWDDELWELVWERNLNPLERHRIAMAVCRRRPPPEPYEAVVGAELSRRWRRRALNLAFLYALWTLFWGALAVSDLRDDAALTSLLTPVNTLIGIVAIAACFLARHWIRDVAERFSAPASQPLEV